MNFSKIFVRMEAQPPLKSFTTLLIQRVSLNALPVQKSAMKLSTGSSIITHQVIFTQAHGSTQTTRKPAINGIPQGVVSRQMMVSGVPKMEDLMEIHLDLI